MKAVQLTAVGEPLALRDVEIAAPADDEVVVQVAGCGVCHTDIGFWKDGVPTKKALPLTLGHEISGTVVEAGAVSHVPLLGYAPTDAFSPPMWREAYPYIAGAAEESGQGKGRGCNLNLPLPEQLDGTLGAGQA